ncbi:MAG: peptide-methionine (S)-S-oxide reductase MsrA [Bacteroidales bacterium]|nr:peptide-methionine (S)-S-oxide reductase MsrA [Bacteroidales bacterium]
MTKKIYLAGGCFWGAEHFLKRICGVVSTRVGFANGNVEAPSYELVYTDTTGHAETVEVEYDPDRLSLAFLVEMFFRAIDPLSLNRQGGDSGTRYRTGIYYVDPVDLESIMYIFDGEARKYSEPLAVEVLPLKCFYPAEDYHQDYLDRNPGGYCHLPAALFELSDGARCPMRRVRDFLEANSMPYEIYFHPPLSTIEKALAYWKDIKAVHCKNLFMRNHKGNRHYLISFECHKEFDIHALEHVLHQGKLSFASPERMARCLGLRPGSVSPFGLINDRAAAVAAAPVSPFDGGSAPITSPGSLRSLSAGEHSAGQGGLEGSAPPMNNSAACEAGSAPMMNPGGLSATDTRGQDKELFENGHRVKLYLDQDLRTAEKISFHPCDNTASVVIAREDFLRFLQLWGGEYEWIDCNPAQ